MIANSLSAPHRLGSWKADAVRIVEELFRETPASAWDLLLELRQALAHGNDWRKMLDAFLACRLELEADHYLPFYRLRRLLAASLKLEAVLETGCREVRPLMQLLQSRHRSLADLEKSIRRELFEHSLEDTSSIALRLIEKA